MAPYQNLYESAAGLVLKAYRSQGISKRLQWFLLHRWAPSRYRVACLAAYYPVNPRPQSIYLPEAYAEIVKDFYGPLGRERSFLPATEPLPSSIISRQKTMVFDFASVMRVAFEDIGVDLPACLEEIEEVRKVRGIQVIQASVKLDSPWTGAVVEVFREKGYFLGGVLPRWFDEDGLLLQKLFCSPDWDRIRLYTDRAKAMLRVIREDQERKV